MSGINLDAKKLGDYHDIYLKSDVLLLAECYENFRTSGVNLNGIDCSYYITLPSYAWQATW